MGDDIFPFEAKAHFSLFENRITLAVIAASPTHPDKTGFLTTESEGVLSLPYVPLLKGEHSREVARKLFIELTGLDPTAWAILQQTGFIDTEDDHQIVLYTIMIPDRIALKDSSYKWLTSDELMDDHIKRGPSRPTAMDLFSYASHISQVGA